MHPPSWPSANRLPSVALVVWVGCIKKAKFFASCMEKIFAPPQPVTQPVIR